MATYVVSDIHGYYDLFLSGLRKIGFCANDFLWCLGDAIDRGPDGIKVLQLIKSHSNMEMLIGNHELMMLNSVDPAGEDICNGRDTSTWLDGNDGIKTFDRYKVLPIQERKELLEWLNSRYVIKTLDVKDKHFCLTHSFYSSRCKNKRYNEMSYTDAWNITWSSVWREDFLTHGEDVYSQYDYTFVVGHVPVQNIRCRNELEEWYQLVNLRLSSFRSDNVVAIDGGCALGSTKVFENGIIILRLPDLSEQYVYMKT